jgi:SagB-type dehydrogenase family enzyme
MMKICCPIKIKTMSQGTGRQFLQQTKYKYLKPSAQQMGFSQPPLEKEPVSGQELIRLPKPDSRSLVQVDLLKAIDERKSIRSYSMDPFTPEELSLLLWSTQGIKNHVPGHATFRTVPSAGARHAFETYLLINRVSELAKGLYHYHAIEHTLSLISSAEEVVDLVVKGALGQEMIRNAAVCFIWTADVERMTWRYGERGYRYLFLDAGHVCQNLYLSCQMINAGTCAIAAFDDDQMNDIIGVNGEDEFVIYMASVGKKGEKEG